MLSGTVCYPEPFVAGMVCRRDTLSQEPFVSGPFVAGAPCLGSVGRCTLWVGMKNTLLKPQKTFTPEKVQLEIIEVKDEGKSVLKVAIKYNIRYET